MQIILLSGGEGKRLFPLSNSVRSKQFLRVLGAPGGGRESMLQRVTRQIGRLLPGSSVTIATGAAQREMILGQLGGGVRIVAEPERRDTFPAIALAAMYLSLELGCPRGETVVVMPCDQYADDGYFRTVERMCRAVEDNAAELVLMGIRPTYASTKFGYVVPKDGAPGREVCAVERFTEKPGLQRARELMEQGALWNGGVFAFRLGYMTDIAERYVRAESFDKVRARYGEFPKISFDYEVAEKAASVAVVPFSGEWKDLGTWNTLTEQLPERIEGRAIMDDESLGTHILNELDIPVVCLGVRDLVVAAGSDGILVCDRSASERIKDFAGAVADPQPRFEERLWGTVRVLDRVPAEGGGETVTRRLTVRAGAELSCRTAVRRVWTVAAGCGTLAAEGSVRTLSAAETISLEPHRTYRLDAISEMTLLEIETPMPGGGGTRTERV